MFYIVEEDSKLSNLEKLLRLGCYVEVITSNDSVHPKLSSVVAVYVRLLKSQHGFIIPINHDEGINVDKERVYTILKSCNKLYTLNKKELLYHFNLQGAIDISLLFSMVKYDRLEIKRDSANINHFYSKFQDHSNINQLIPISKLFESRENTFDQVKEFIDLDIPDGFEFYNTLATNIFFLLEQSGLGIHYEAYKEHFNPRNILHNTLDNTVFTSYNLYNATSRPTNSFNSVNYAAIPHTEHHRKAFKPKNDYFVEFDFDGYHLRLLCDQINYELTDSSAHKQLAKLYFGKEEITDEEYTQAKQINFQAIYGKIPEEHKDLEIFKQIQEYIDTMWNSFNNDGYVWNTQSKKQFTKELKDMHPAKLMNYMMQSLETSNNILILKEVLRYLKDKKTTAALYTYDAILFDYSKEDGKKTLEDLQEILSDNKKYPVKFKFSKNLVL